MISAYMLKVKSNMNFDSKIRKIDRQVVTEEIINGLQLISNIDIAHKFIQIT